MNEETDIFVLIKQHRAIVNRSLDGFLRYQETPRLLCRSIALRPRFVLLVFCPETALYYLSDLIFDAFCYWQLM